MRSGVNWIREKRRSSAWASECTSSFLARPGTPMIRQFPPASSATRVCSITASWPTMILLSSASTRPRAAESRSARATSSMLASPAGEEVTVTRCPFGSAGEGVDDVVHAELVGFVGEIDREVPLVGEFPVFAHVEVVIHHHQQAFLRIIVLEDPVELRGDGIIRVREVEVLDSVEGIEDRMLGGERYQPRLRQDLLHLRFV